MAEAILRGNACGDAIGVGRARILGGARRGAQRGDAQSRNGGEYAGCGELSGGEPLGKETALESGAPERSEEERFRLAEEEFVRKTRRLIRRAEERIDASEADILREGLLILSDPSMEGAILRRIQEGARAEDAVSETVAEESARLRATGDALIAGRAVDVEDIGSGLLRALNGQGREMEQALSADSVVVAREIFPSDILRFAEKSVAGIVAEKGGRTSHAAILARGYGIPAVFGVPNACRAIAEEALLAVCSDTGEVWLSPDEDDLFGIRVRTALKSEAHTGGVASENAISAFQAVTAADRMPDLFPKRAQETAEGGADCARSNGAQDPEGGLPVEPVRILCNIGLPEEASRAAESGADGIGLFRTEVFFLGRSDPPGEEEQFGAYRGAALAMDGRPVTIRTLDIGGDKAIPGILQEAEENPYLGLRGIRFGLAHPDLLRTQLRAILRAGAFGALRVMLPMVTREEEIARVRELVRECSEELSAEGIAHDGQLPVGCMIETPAAVLIADRLARLSDFFSIGTNDLAMYVMCADRGNAAVADYCDAGDPAVLGAVRKAAQAARAAGIKTSVCGEAASDPELILQYLAMGIREFSVPPMLVGRIRELVRGGSGAPARG